MMPEPTESAVESGTDLDTIRQAALMLLKDDGAAMVLEYGSSLRNESANDIDLYAVYPGDREASNLELGQADIMRHCRAAMDHYADHLDPVRYSEPILKGEVLFGDGSLHDHWRESLLEREPTSKAVEYNQKRCRQEFEKTAVFLDEGLLEEVVQTLSFCVSFAQFSAWYNAGHQPVTYATVRDDLESDLPVEEVQDMLCRAKEGTDLSEKSVRALRSKVERHLP